ncbi:MAG: shikimate dehydrogenase [Bacteroidia bacterium]|jgi:shikimate dehydrogenase|nr:shikimate dehydrogenase [Bacteroidia bacterium]
MVELFGLLGKSLKHSFSKPYFENKFKALHLTDYRFENFELPSLRDFPELLKNNPRLKGLSVTLPYKEDIIPYLDALSEEAKVIGAVNSIKIINGETKGYNTDVFGFTQSIKPFLDFNHQQALILGTGGAAKAVAYALKKIGVEIRFVTSDAKKKKENVFMYAELNAYVFQSHKLIVNCTPLGMFPNEASFPPLPYEHFSSEHLAYDLVYNPAETVFLRNAAEKGASVVNGLSMLKLQAEKSWEIWNSA